MPRNQPRLILVHEPERACFERLVADGHAPERAAEISSYLAQSTDLAAEFDALAAACDKRGLAFAPVELDEAAGVLAGADREATLVWTLTDGVAYFRGGAAPALARLNGLRTIGADDSVFALCQDKFRSGAVLGALGLPVPRAGLARDGNWLVAPPASQAGWFVKPNRLGAKIGIWPDSRVDDLGHALELSRRVFAHYRDDVVVQPYVAGRNVRASFLGLKPDTGVEALGIAFVESGGDFQTMADSLALYGDTGVAAKVAGTYAEPELQPVAASQPAADRAIRAMAQKLIGGLGLKDVFSIDLRLEADDTVHLIEFEVCPGLPCFDFRAYCASQWGLGLADAMAETARTRLG
ncbi:D-alanine:D-lactate ligase-like protein [Mesorhizobium sp. M4B.F.Ca.ET.190.01.1.1]|uniref:D-alanine:D-lactate ligase-like protein n=1 Tax=unclassified Mesorhizobium TaxID=325217 RepID=UPI000FE7E2C0|nr:MULTISPECIES: D-alanine:D-lactate ligase-like protein [unclassified Mesorhizobium]RWA61263.1 MAG: D-alanine:D-lactate ligase-like protein [Mesorhizobium sp.]TGR08807.1 D-alanine:D-lactate ligase-like protein [Mesorhizobium sp. M4B.F.Ca.ET.200.01.1.1]TGS18284.1 D-alanine:D-lactate ligase-like protein [Mesorhizobium sp. M4B.F.Ca.ET.190.01.1.1]TGT30097.1 D-alanine:D-lactate ligase-like protein [Mesorhizobium sp. M4B.F.Ca.ET.172.01.1.1]